MKLIDADKLKAHYAWWGDTEERYTFDTIIDMQPEVDAVPVVHGHWENIEDDYETVTRCSVCGFESVDAGLYCSNCGAKMDEE